MDSWTTKCCLDGSSPATIWVWRIQIVDLRAMQPSPRQPSTFQEFKMRTWESCSLSSGSHLNLKNSNCRLKSLAASLYNVRCLIRRLRYQQCFVTADVSVRSPQKSLCIDMFLRLKYPKYVKYNFDKKITGYQEHSLVNTQTASHRHFSLFCTEKQER